jgi:alpha-L-rhamnosidase
MNQNIFQPRDPFRFDRQARWIWLSKGAREENQLACFRKTFDIASVPSSAKLNITADARYEVYVNGQFVGHGPVRSWPQIWSVDEYDIAPLLRRGKNVIAVLVLHWGISTFQYINAEPGLLAEIHLGGKRKIVTDGSWKSLVHPGYAHPTPRISCQQGWEEQFDAQKSPGAPEAWTQIEFKDSMWLRAAVSRPAGAPPHEIFERRDIPFLTHDPVSPLRVLDTHIVKTANYTWSINPHSAIGTDDRTANQFAVRLLLVTHIHSPSAQSIQLHDPHVGSTRWKLNGKTLEFADKSLQHTDGGVAHARLKKGWNTLMAKPPDGGHQFWAVINLWAKQPPTFSAIPSNTKSQPWLAVGPFAAAPRPASFDHIFVMAEKIDPPATAERFEQIWQRGVLNAKDLGEKFCSPLSPQAVCTTDIFAMGASERIVTNASPRIDEPSAFLADNANWTTVYPSRHGDVRFLLDFGREVIGFHEFEIRAPAGTILDFHNFEFIQRDGRKNLAEGMNNSFRYICRAGVHRYRSIVRRGFRYSWMSLRNFHSPVRIRFVRIRMSTYPFTNAGDFACSDDRLTEIWKAGVHSVRCCAEDTYTDCPTYEQTLWVGDARNEALVDLIANGDPRLSHRCLTLTGRSLMRSPITESQVPSGWQNILPAWTFLWMRWAQEHFLHTGDREAAKELLEYLDQNFQGIHAAINDLGLFEMHAWNLFDWAPMDTPAKGIVTHVSCLAVQALRQSADLAEAMNQKSRSNAWRKLADQIATAVNKHLWSDKAQAYIDCIRADGSLSDVFSQQTQTSAYISGVATATRAERCRQIIRQAPKGFVQAGSPFFMFFLLEALVRQNDFEGLINTIRSYWGKQIEAGATTFWEMYHESKPRLTRSHCHGWSAAPVVFLTQHVLGIQPASPGYARVRIAPHLGNLQWAQGRVPTPHGMVSCSWRRKGNQCEIIVQTPAGVPAEIELPKGMHLKSVAPDVHPGLHRQKNTPGPIITRGGDIRINASIDRPSPRASR